MSVWGKLKTHFSGRPHPPKAKPFTPDPYVGQYSNRANQADEAGFRLLMDELNRIPGYTPEEYRQISEVPIEAINQGQRRALSANNRAAAYSGKFASGGRAGNEGLIRTAGMRNRAMVNMRAPAMAADFARRDRLRQIAAASQFALPRQQMGLQHTGMLNNYNMGLNDLAFKSYLSELGQYNKDFDQVLKEVKTAAKYFMKMKGMGFGG